MYILMGVFFLQVLRNLGVFYHPYRASHSLLALTVEAKVKNKIKYEKQPQ